MTRVSADGVLRGCWNAASVLARRLLVRRPDVEPHRDNLDWLSSQMVDHLRHEPSSLPTLYRECLPQWRRALAGRFGDLSDREMQWVFCFAVAHACAPWGSRAAEFRFPALLHEPFLTCANYGVLGWHLAKLFPDLSEDADLHVHFVGWESAAIGNHQVLFLSRPRGPTRLLIDPTIGLVAAGTFDEVACGVPIGIERMALFQPRPNLRDFEQLVLRGLALGRLRPSELLYYFDSPEALARSFADPSAWPTPGAIPWRRRNAKRP